MKKFLKVMGVLSVIVLALAAVVWFKFCPKLGADETLTFSVDSEYSKWIGKSADFDFVSLDGRRVASTELRGKVVLLDFWATWCPACVQSLDALKGVHSKYASQGLEVVAINFDEDRAALEKMVADKGLVWPQYFEGRDNSIGRRFGISHYPSAWLIDRAGNVRFISALRDADGKISTLLGESEAQAAEFGRNLNSGYVGRLNAGLTTLRTLKTGGLLNSVAVRAKTSDSLTDSNVTAAGPAPANLAGLSNALKVGSVILSAKPSAVIKTAEGSRHLMIGDTLRLRTTQGEVELRCESIQSTGVRLQDVQSGMKVELRLN